MKFEKNIETFLGCESEFDSAQVVLFGAPFDGTTSYRPGTRFGPSAIRHESFGLETYSPYCDADLLDYAIFDDGDLELPFGNTNRVLGIIEAKVKSLLDANKRFVMLGGEHLITLGAFRSVYEKYPNVRVIHLDAHTDLRSSYLGEELSHSTVIRHIWNLVQDDRIYQFGIRSGEREEFLFASEHTHLHKFNMDGWKECVAALKDYPVYFTLDLDVLDPSIFCGTGTPEAGGISFQQLMEVILDLHQLNIVGCDINELSPHYDQSGSSSACACKVTREILLQICMGGNNNE